MNSGTSLVHASSVPDAAREYLRRGWAPIPVRPGTKKPPKEGWTQLRLREEDISAQFAKGRNVGVLLGKPSGGLVDVDLDTAAAGALAPLFLPETGAVFGRPGKPASHWLYIAYPLPSSRRFQFQTISSRDRKKQTTTIAEVRSTGVHTVFPPSQHSGETIGWCKSGIPVHVDGVTLMTAVAHLSAAVVLVRHWPGQGSRQDAALALAGGLSRAGWPPERVAKFIAAVASTAGDEEAATRATAAHFTEKRLAVGGPATGFPRLAEIIGEAAVKCIIKWLDTQRRSTNPGGGSLQGGEPDGKAPSQAQMLVSIALGGDVFHTPEGEAYAAVRVNGHTETWPVRSKGFKTG